MGIDVIFKIAAIGILTAVVAQILKNSGKDDIATIATLSGVVVALITVLDLISQLFSTLKSMFGF